jgi:multicomponent Na+:H+ antiporter subunit A
MGTAVAVALAGGASNPVGEAPVRDLATTAQDDGGGKNVVNVILTDTRALDTMGEIIVLLVVAVGVVTLGKRRRGNRSTPVSPVAVDPEIARKLQPSEAEVTT